MQHDLTFAEVCADWPGWTPSALSGFEWWTLMAPKKRQHRPIPRFHDKVFSPPHLCIWNMKFDAFKLLCNSPDAISIGVRSSQVTPRGQIRIERGPHWTQLAHLGYPSILANLLTRQWRPTKFGLGRSRKFHRRHQLA